MRRRQGLAILLGTVLSVAALGQSVAPATNPAALGAGSHQPHHQTRSSTYTNSAGVRVRRPMQTVNESAPAGATAQCRDGSYSFSLSHRGTCSHHGGVARWL
ncbi:DUF3761 domain-containing protein [Frateuria sp. YIM B11624]|uniref:DUF3761 domain-containing protein n=1 Tax=Frateuria sp. YIM B11624 TaxID=3143185 RepID=UPI003C76738D